MDKITSFKDIPLQPGTLYVLDFDETIAYYDGINQAWWSERFDYHYEKHSDYNKADRLSLKDWMDHISFLQPRHVDKEGLNNIINHCNGTPNSHVMILTARDIMLEDVTRKHMDLLSPNEQLDIVFCNGEHKGEKLKEYFDQNGQSYKNIIFVDDLDQNLKEVMEIYKNARCYHMTHKI